MAIGERLRYYDDDEWFLLWARLEAAAIRLCATVCRHDVTGEILGLQASDRARREVESLIARGCVRMSAGKPFEAFARRRVTWRCLSALDSWKRQTPTVNLEDLVRPGSDERYIDRIEAIPVASHPYGGWSGDDDDHDDRTMDCRPGPRGRRDCLADPGTLAALREMCHPRERALLHLIAALEAVSRDQPQLSGPERSKTVMGRLGLSRNEFDRQRYRLRKKLGRRCA